MTPRALPRLARTPFFTTHESGGICRQPSSDVPSKIFRMPAGSGTPGGGTAPMLAIDCCVVGAVVFGSGGANAGETERDTNTAAKRHVRIMPRNDTGRARKELNRKHEVTKNRSECPAVLRGFVVLL